MSKYLISLLSDLSTSELLYELSTIRDVNVVEIKEEKEKVLSADFFTCDGWGAQNGPGGWKVTLGTTVVIEGNDSENRTNNFRELEAIVNACRYIDRHIEENIPRIIYSDSVTAISWVTKGKPNTKDDKEKVMELIREAQDLIKKHDIKIKKWFTSIKGEIYSDAGRK